ncbi:EAL and GGDEF domain-containing protein [Aquibacillus albus]|uniref:Diguanylate cyclase (GGDEF)-like protein/PAS domain S-box-containing protein n=1 Tax=Aquibacillus albus TaxID=1168171 RepID=A0ABS2N3C3_9BACI|nr:GGDEF domain-containing phosphodiesterase [Aquibacillus albus]MBM7572415.1 diguanylate cyclase (GGDEF)-like protein/PAS domain S-box-containing protein [Aquibacillus albus]
MTLLNLDDIFDRQKLNQLFGLLSDSNRCGDKLDSRVNELIEYIKEQFNVYQDLKYAIDHSATVTITDQSGRITYVDNNFCKQSGYSKDELLNRNHRILNAGHHSSSFFSDMWKTILNGDVWKGEVKNRRKDGTFFWVRTTIVPLLNEDNVPESFIAFQIDITEKIKLQYQLIEALNHDYRRIFRKLMNLVFRVVQQNGEFHFTMVEGKLSKKIGISTDYSGLKPIDFIFGKENIIDIKEKFEQVFSGEEVTFKHQLGNLYLYSMLSPVMEGGNVIEVIGSSVDITSLEEAEQKIRHLAYHDQLTDLPNRSKLREDVDSFIRKERKGDLFGVLHFGLDRLKYVNDALGQFAGDQVLITIAKRIREVIGEEGKIYRIGGDEFIAIVKGDEKQVDEISDDVVKQIKKPISVVGKEFFVTSSIGISLFEKDGTSTEELISYAGIAMHFCKVSGRNSKLFYSPKMNSMYNELLLLEGEIRKALSNEDFKLYYQPKVSVETGEIIGVEALIRWFHKEKGFISPSKFIPLAEEAGLITQLGEWVVRQACMQHKKWVDTGYPPVSIAVNVSAIELQRNDFSEKVKAIIDEVEIDPSFLELEITENSVMQNTEDCIKTMNELRSIGISLSIDDFGTGYSSFGYLRKFPINNLKIDQSFVKNSLIESNSAEIIKAMIQLAHTFGLKVIAEGVENEFVLNFLKSQQCDYYQGYYHSKPIPPEDMEQMMVLKV